MGIFLMAVAATLVGTVASCVLACLPGLHIYNVMGLLVVFILALEGIFNFPPEVYIPMMTGMVVGWSMLNTIPAIMLGAPDESAIFTVLPGQKYLMFGRGYEGTMMTGVGGLIGLFLLVVVVAPLAPLLLPMIREITMPFMGAVIWLIITFILMSEWPKGGNVGPAGFSKFLDAWRSLGAGLATFLLSGLMGFILLYRSPISTEMAFQNIMPAFVGLFAIPWCLLNAISGAEVPEQHVADSLDVDAPTLLRSAASGGLGGGFAAFFPVITGGVGGLLAGHATAQRDERVFIMSQGVSKLMYYTGAFMFLFVPGIRIRRGGGAWIMSTLYTPRTMSDYLMAVGAIALAGAVSYLLMSPLTRGLIKLIRVVNYRYISVVALLIIVGLVYAITGWVGLFIMLVGTGIGLIPVLFASRRLNCLGILLLPIGSNMSGFGPAIAAFLGLV